MSPGTPINNFAGPTGVAAPPVAGTTDEDIVPDGAPPLLPDKDAPTPVPFPDVEVDGPEGSGEDGADVEGPEGLGEATKEVTTWIELGE